MTGMRSLVSPAWSATPDSSPWWSVRFVSKIRCRHSRLQQINDRRGVAKGAWPSGGQAALLRERTFALSKETGNASRSYLTRSVDPSKYEEVRNLLVQSQTILVPAIRMLRGNLAYYVGLDRENSASATSASGRRLRMPGRWRRCSRCSPWPGHLPMRASASRGQSPITRRSGCCREAYSWGPDSQPPGAARSRFPRENMSN